MRIVHWTLSNHSGLNRMATLMCEAEVKLGLDSVVAYTDGGAGQSAPGLYKIVDQQEALTADIHCSHSFVPDEAMGKRIFIPHGTPEHCFQSGSEQIKRNYAEGDPLMLSYYNIDNTEVTVTFWERHQYIWQSFNPKARVITVPMGVDKEFWAEGSSRGKYAGNPSLFTAENFHTIKWPLDLILAWPLVMKENKSAILHMHYVPHDMHRFFYPLIFKNGTAYKSYSSGNFVSKPDLRNAFKSSDYYIGLVRYGDHNTICLEAKAAGAKVISYRGNEYADFWISEGDQREMARELSAIFKGEVEPRETTPVPDISETAKAMKEVYESL